jgi:hypothetical protein
VLCPLEGPLETPSLPRFHVSGHHSQVAAGARHPPSSRPAVPSSGPIAIRYPISICHHLIQHLLNLDGVQQLRNGLPYIITYTPFLGTCFLLIPRTTPKTVFPISVPSAQHRVRVWRLRTTIIRISFSKKISLAPQSPRIRFSVHPSPVDTLSLSHRPHPLSSRVILVLLPVQPRRRRQPNLGPAPSHPFQLPLRGRPGPAEPVVTWSCTDVRTAW